MTTDTRPTHSNPTDRENAGTLRLGAAILYAFTIAAALLDGSAFLAITFAVTVPVIYAFLVFADLAERGTRTGPTP